jgi:hypothetical protein
MSTSNASGRTSSMPRRRSSASCSARAQNVRTARFCAPSGVPATKSPGTMRSIVESSGAASKPRARIGPASDANVLSATSCPLRASSSRTGVIGNR